MKSYLLLMLILLGSQLFAQENIHEDGQKKIFNHEGKDHSFYFKGLFFIYPLGNGHIVNYVGGVGIQLLKKHHLGLDISYNSGIDHSDFATDTFGVTHAQGEESHSKENAYTIYYHYHFNLFNLNEKMDLSFFAGAFCRYKTGIAKSDPFYMEQYISQKETGYDYGITTGIAKTFKAVPRLRIEGGIGFGKQERSDYTKYIENNIILYNTEKSSYLGPNRIELGVYWTFF